jgi:hypothetical protein
MVLWFSDDPSIATIRSFRKMAADEITRILDWSSDNSAVVREPGLEDLGWL